MNIISNSYRSGPKLAPGANYPSVEIARVQQILSGCALARETPLAHANGLAPVADFWVKDERTRMGLGSFKALGAAYVIAREAYAISKTEKSGVLKDRVFVTASAGNHGLSVAFGAKIYGAKAVVYLADTVPESFAARLAELGADVIRAGSDYQASMDAAMAAAEENDWTLLSDTSWAGYRKIPTTLMEGYLQMAHEAGEQCAGAPSHIFLQAGVGGLACAAAAYARLIWGDEPVIAVVEPENAPALQASIAAGKCVFADGPESVMGRLDCKEPSLVALNGLARDADYFVTLSDKTVEDCLPTFAAVGLATTSSGGAGMAAVMQADVRSALNIGKDARVLTYLSEKPA
ncbi:MAG: pyridoxal-phosphate dependent enzyme [Pseudomonadota bacterium]